MYNNNNNNNKRTAKKNNVHLRETTSYLTFTAQKTITNLTQYELPQEESKLLKAL